MLGKRKGANNELDTPKSKSRTDAPRAATPPTVLATLSTFSPEHPTALSTVRNGCERMHGLFKNVKMMDFSIILPVRFPNNDQVQYETACTVVGDELLKEKKGGKKIHVEKMLVENNQYMNGLKHDIKAKLDRIRNEGGEIIGVAQFHTNLPPCPGCVDTFKNRIVPLLLEDFVDVLPTSNNHHTFADNWLVWHEQTPSLRDKSPIHCVQLGDYEANHDAWIDCLALEEAQTQDDAPRPPSTPG